MGNSKSKVASSVIDAEIVEETTTKGGVDTKVTDDVKTTVTSSVTTKARAVEKTTTKSSVDKSNNTDTDTETDSPWYVFCSTGCGFCKKAEPVIEELNKEGHDILVLDVTEPDNQKLNQELQQEYGTRCGTPWFINADTGKGVCGFRDKAILEKWLAGEDIPEPPRPKGQMPRLPLLGSDNKVELEWKREYKKWTEENKHMPNLQSAEQLLERPRPKTEPPGPPNPNMTAEEMKVWGESYDKWAKENDHLPNLQPAASIIARFNRQNAIQGMQGQDQPGVPPQGPPGSATPGMIKIDAMDAKLDRLMAHLGVK